MANTTKTKVKTVYKIKWKNLRKLLTMICIIAGLICAGSFSFQKYRDYRSTTEVIANIKKKVTVTNVVDDELTKAVPQESTLSKFDPHWNYIKLSLIDADMAVLKKINTDTIGYMEIKGTNFEYPIVYSENDFYKTHSFDKKENSYGWIYSQDTTETLNDNTIIQANKVIGNVLSSHLKTVFKTSWSENNDNFIIKYSTNYASMMFRIISVYHTKGNEHLKTEFTSDEEAQEFMTSIKRKSEVKFKTEARPGDNLLTITTNSKGENIVIHAKLIKIKEEE